MNHQFAVTKLRMVMRAVQIKNFIQFVIHITRTRSWHQSVRMQNLTKGYGYFVLWNVFWFINLWITEELHLH